MARCRQFAALLLMAAVGWPLVGCGRFGAVGTTLPLRIGGHSFAVELALDEASRFQGLSDRPSIPDDGGMLFVFPGAQQRIFVMRRCLVPIDLVYLGPNGRIVRMHHMEVEPAETWHTPARQYPSCWPAQFAVELKGGTIDRLGLKIGDRIELPLEALKRRVR